MTQKIALTCLTIKQSRRTPPEFDPKHHCPIIQQTAFEAKRFSSSGDVMNIAYELNTHLAYLHNSTFSAVQNEERWYWKSEDQCFVKNDYSFDSFDVSSRSYSHVFDFIGTKQVKAGECSLYSFLDTELCFSKGVLFQECHGVCHSELCESQCFDYVDHKEISREDKRFDPQELDCDHFNYAQAEFFQ
ncbi:hypothetical protein GEMRC1_014128 [Eukaryota sp. GEM-RC1]